MNYNIRLAVHNDIKQLAVLDKKAFPPNPEEDPWGESHYKYYIEHHHAFVILAEIKQEIIGKSVGMIYNGCVNKGLQILDLSVLSKYKRLGIGYELMWYLEALGKHLGCSYSSLNVMRKSKPALKLYKKLGYEFISGQDLDKDNLLRMKKKL